MAPPRLPVIPPRTTFERWTVLMLAELRGRSRFYLCRCTCGTERLVREQNLRHGHTQSCGCLQREQVSARFTRHGYVRGDHRPPEYMAWEAMIQRCTNPKHQAYANYGGRGITVCDEWRGDFPRFLADLGQRPSPEHSLDRIKNDLGYFPGNVQWAVKVTQANNMRTNRILALNGERHTLAEWSRVAGLPRWKLKGRINRGWPLERALQP